VCIARPLAIAGGLLAWSCPALQAETAWESATADFAKICVASLLDAGSLPAALLERELTPQQAGHWGAGWDGVAYSSKDGDRGVTINYQTYSDLKISHCIRVALVPTSRDQLEELRLQLEANPKIGKLEGKIVDATPTVKLAMLKRAGNSPIVTFNFTTTSTATTLNMNRWDVKANN